MTTTTTNATTPTDAPVSAGTMVWSFVPWIAYLVGSRFLDLRLALGVATVVAVYVFGRLILRGVVPYGAPYAAYRYTMRASRPDAPTTSR